MLSRRELLAAALAAPFCKKDLEQDVRSAKEAFGVPVPPVVSEPDFKYDKYAGVSCMYMSTELLAYHAELLSTSNISEYLNQQDFEDD